MPVDREPLLLLVNRLSTPIGELLIVSDRDQNLRAVDWADCEERMRRLLRIHSRGNEFNLVLTHSQSSAAEAIARYFRGDLSSIDVPPTKTEGTAFQQDVWRVLRTIPCGTSISYSELAARVGRPRASRAVGLANGSNPISIVVPCHRVIGSDGSLTGYAGGTKRKLWLLRHETQNR